MNQSMMEGSRTGKAAEADLMILIGKSPSVEGRKKTAHYVRINIVKNKLNGWHGVVNCELELSNSEVHRMIEVTITDDMLLKARPLAVEMGEAAQLYPAR